MLRLIDRLVANLVSLVFGAEQVDYSRFLELELEIDANENEPMWGIKPKQ